MNRATAILVDFGSSRVKAALVDIATGTVVRSADSPSPEAQRGEQGKVEVDPFLLRDAMLETAGRLATGDSQAPAGIWLCSEMHGFLLDDGQGKPLTSYVSWRDERAGTDSTPSTLAQFEQFFGLRYQQVTGMALRPGIPCLALAHMARHGRLPAGARFLSLPEWLAVSSGNFYDVAHETIAAASGLYDIEARSWSGPILDRIGAGSGQLRLSEVFAGFEQPIGMVRFGSRELPLYGGIGDMQAAVLGAGIPSRAGIAVNLGTGSQVARAVPGQPGLHGERRPFFDGKVLAAITHIPCGRALNVYSRIADGFAVASGGRAGVFWKLLSRTEVSAILAAPLRVDLNVFASSWRFKNGGAITGFLEEFGTAEQLVASMARSWIEQYAEAIALLDPARECGRVALAGGLARRVPAAAAVLSEITGREVLPPVEDEETIAGLAVLAKNSLH